MGVGLLGGAVGTRLAFALKAIDQEVGHQRLGGCGGARIGLIAAAINPSRSVGWVRAGILYGLVVLIVSRLVSATTTARAFTSDL